MVADIVRPPGRWPGGLKDLSVRELDGRADLVQDRADLAAQEDEGDDRDDRDERQDQGVLSEALAFLVAAGKVRRDESDKFRHVVHYLLSVKSPRPKEAPGVDKVRAGLASVKDPDRTYLAAGRQDSENRRAFRPGG